MPLTGVGWDVFLLGYMSHVLGYTLHASWVTLDTPLGMHSIPLGSRPWFPCLLGCTMSLGVYIPRGMKCNPRGVPQIHASWTCLLGHMWFYRCTEPCNSVNLSNKSWGQNEARLPHYD